ncbi:MAG TPA: hypothetical protein VK054_06660, partial [Beutenbergiaceae bacterium]|nr:hypothetical protein [Beutenbergiaceae bacterium]
MVQENDNDEAENTESTPPENAEDLPEFLHTEPIPTVTGSEEDTTGEGDSSTDAGEETEVFDAVVAPGSTAATAVMATPEEEEPPLEAATAPTPAPGQEKPRRRKRRALVILSTAVVLVAGAY